MLSRIARKFIAINAHNGGGLSTARENIFRKLYKFTFFQLLVRHTKNLYFLSLAISLSSFFSLTLSATTTVTRDLFADTTTCKKRRRNDMKKKNFLHNMKYWTDGSRKNVGRICLKECGISCSAQAQCVDSIQGIYIDIANFKSRHVRQICKSFFSPSRFFPNLFGENLPPPQADVLILETTTDTSTRRCRWRRERDQYSRESLFACHEVSEDVFNFPSIFFSRSSRQKVLQNYLIYHLQSGRWVYCCEGSCLYLIVIFQLFFLSFMLSLLSTPRTSAVWLLSLLVLPLCRLKTRYIRTRTKIHKKCYNII